MVFLLGSEKKQLQPMLGFRRHALLDRRNSGSPPLRFWGLGEEGVGLGSTPPGLVQDPLVLTGRIIVKDLSG
ncbi:hypothetical protein CGMCC3_g1815 [Colletotrichum fructicola]|nr:uncharacterized protein CGMCC3_g1815 [Colletotrichum fructicola]KAE9582568.1 hypothetical protein CGMCC3_g1815 [Colletotrichum fructicola]